MELRFVGIPTSTWREGSLAGLPPFAPLVAGYAPPMSLTEHAIVHPRRARDIRDRSPDVDQLHIRELLELFELASTETLHIDELPAGWVSKFKVGL